MRKLLQKRIKSDDGNPIVILGLLLIIVSLLVGGMMLDISKAYQFKSSYIEAAKKATQAGIRIQSAEGYLTSESITETIRVYETIARPSTMRLVDTNSKDTYMSRCKVKGQLSSREITITLGTVTEDGEVTLGVGVQNLDLDKIKDIRNKFISSQSGTAQSINAEIRERYPEISGLRKAVLDNNYNYIQMEIYESTPNTVLPGAFAASGGDKESILCQRLAVRASASQYIEKDEDN